MGTINQIYKEGDIAWLGDGVRLWRYFPLKTLWVYLSKHIYIPSIQKLRESDPFEGEFSLETRDFNDAMSRAYGVELEAMEKWFIDTKFADWEKWHAKRNRGYLNAGALLFQKHYFDFIRKTRFAWCWFEENSEDAAMWSNYGDQGVAISTTVGKIKAMLCGNSKQDFEFGKMRYVRMEGCEIAGGEINDENPIDAQFILKPHFLKRHEYKRENEVRFVAAAPENEMQGGIILDKVDPALWIEKIVLWPKLKPVEVASLQEAVGKYALDIPCGCSDLFGSESLWSFRSAFLKDYSELERRAWQDDSDGIPPRLKRL